MGTHGVGSDIEDICTRCGDTWHAVVAKIGDRVVKVVCKLCNVQHNYRRNNAEAPAAGTSGGAGGPGKSTKGTKSRKKVAVAALVVPKFDPSKPPRPYSAKEAFLPGERVQHPSFGTGIVAAVPGPGKVDVVFPSGARTLASAKAMSTLERPTAAANVPIADRPPDAK